MITNHNNVYKMSKLCNNYYVLGTILRNSLMAQMVKRVPTVRETRFDPWIGKIPWRRKWQPLQYSFLENPMDEGAL